MLPYAAAASLTVIADFGEEEADLSDELEAGLAPLHERIDSGLSRVATELLAPYRGAVDVLTAAGPDWQRHLGVSLRTVVDELLSALAPDSALDGFFSNPDQWKENGAYTRRAQLTYIFREVAVDGYAKMAENDIDMTLATFYPSQAAVHVLASALTRRQGLVLLRRVQGCLATILATIEDTR